jgi:NADH:ubiquinone oxidoreductase subunit
VQAPPQCSLANALNQKLNDTTTVAESHLSESKVQINSQPEFAASAKFTTRMFHEAFEPVKLHADNEPTSTETAPGSVGHVRASLLEDTGVSQTDLSIELTQTRLAKDTEPSHIDSTVKRAMMPRSATAESPEGIFTHDDAQTMYKTSSKATQPGATDNIQHSVPSVAVEFDTAKTNKKPDDVDLLSAEGVEELAQTIRDKLTKSTTDTSAITSSPVPMMSKSVNHFPSRKRTKPRNWKQKRATAKLDSIHPSGLNLSRNQDDDASQLSPSTTDSSNVSPPTKRIKEEPISSPTNNQHPSLAPPPRQNAWLNFATIIKQDDDKLKAKLEDERERERKAGNKFRPEIKETYKHQKGRTETVVHEKVGAPAVVKSEDSADVVMKKEGLDGGGSVGGVQIESETSSEVEVKAE